MVDITKLLEQGEGITVEFKEAKRELNKDTFESICAMLNRMGGHLLLGVKDDGTICGVDKDCIKMIKKNFITLMNNPEKICPTFYTQLEEYEIGDKVVLYAQIPDSPDVHRVNGRIFDRNEDGDLNITNNTNLVTQLYNRKSSVGYTERQIYPMVSIEDLDKDTITKVRLMARNQHGGEHPWDQMSDIEFLKSANLYGKDFSTGVEGVNIAGILLLGTRQLILSVLPHYKTDAIVRINDIDRYDDRIVVLDNLIIAYSKLMEFVEKHLNDSFYIEGTQRINVRNKIFREVCANLLIHREFSSGFPAKLIIENNMVHTENANKPHGFGEIDGKNFSPFPKNPTISKFFREIGLADELGSGIRNINKYLAVYSGSKPVFREEDIFTLEIPIKNSSETKKEDTHQDTHRDTHQDRVVALVKFCKVPRSREEIQKFLGLNDRNNFKNNYLIPLLEKRILVMTVPDKPTSKNQKYVINEIVELEGFDL